MTTTAILAAALASGAAGAATAPAVPPAEGATVAFVQVSNRDPRYLELSDGKPFIPIGLNLLHAGGGSDPNEQLARMDAWLKRLAANGGNHVRVWLSGPFWDVEHLRSGQYDEARARRTDALLDSARRHGIRVKLTLEHFRYLDGQRQPWATKPLHHTSQGGPAGSVVDFFDGAASREQFRRKLAWFARRYGSRPEVYAWELWNEVDCVQGGDVMAWSEVMLAELHRLFPRNLAMQSLGSFDTAAKRARYGRLSTMKGNDVAQAHRYLDLGAALEVCHGPVDVLAADAVRELLAFQPARPVILAESGAVERGHSGPFQLYQKDDAGIILHDVLFAPFFAGAAGCGQCWHWDQYVDRKDLWWQFGRFAEAVRGLDPPAEVFSPIQFEQPPLRVYVLAGRRTVLAWCRDGRNTWQTELAEGKPPEPLRGMILDLPNAAGDLTGAAAGTYDPWANRWADAKLDGRKLALPEFRRSIIVRIARPPPR